MKLQTKLLSVLLPLAFVSGILIVFFSKEAVTTILIDGVAQQAVVKLSDISNKLRTAMLMKDEGSILYSLGDSVADLHASYMMALDSSGGVMAHTDIFEKGKHYNDPVTRRALSRDKLGFQLIDVQGVKMVDVTMPIWAADEDFILSQEKGGRTRLGTIRLGLPIDPALATQAKILGRITMILIFTGGVMVAIILLFLRNILLPIRLLSESAGKIGRGEYGVTVPVSSKDEIGHLAQSFNHMSKDLAATTVSKDYLDGVIQSIVDTLIVTDSRGNIRTINHSALKMLGYSDKELLGKPAFLLFDLPDATEENYLELLAGRGLGKDSDLNLLTKSGKTVPVILSCSLLRKSDGRSDGIIIVAKDLTERKKFETMIFQSEKLSAVGQLAAGVAHEINNPLGIILGFAQSANKRINDENPLSLPIKSIEREALRCKTLVQNLLTFSRQNKPKMEEFDLNETVTNTLSIIEAHANVKSVDIIKDLGSLEPLMGDRNQLQQVIVNLCNNAIDAMPNGGKIAVRTRKVDVKGAQHILLEVEDTGAGIPKEIQDKIFNPFFTTKEVGKGTGLGLSLVHEIIQRHKGTIELKSQPGQGTSFKILLPLQN